MISLATHHHNSWRLGATNAETHVLLPISAAYLHQEDTVASLVLMLQSITTLNSEDVCLPVMVLMSRTLVCHIFSVWPL